MLIWLGLVLILLMCSLLGVDLDGLLEALVAALVLAVLTGFVPSTALLVQIILFVVLGLLLFAGLRMGRQSPSKSEDAASDLANDLGTATVLSADVRPERWRVRWRGQNWTAVNGGDPAVPLEQEEEVFVIEREGTCLRVVSKRCLLADD